MEEKVKSFPLLLKKGIRYIDNLSTYTLFLNTIVQDGDGCFVGLLWIADF